MLKFGKIKCCSCGEKTPKAEIKYTQRNWQRLPLCTECWEAAKQVQAMQQVPNRAAEARERWMRSQGVM